MRMPGRLAISAVLCVIVIIPALAEVWTLIRAPAAPQAEILLPATAIAMITGFFCLAFAAWGVATAIGLLRRLSWARSSILLFAGLVIITNGVGVAGYFLTAHEPGGAGILVPRFLLMFVGAWWLMIFGGQKGQRELSATARSR